MKSISAGKTMAISVIYFVFLLLGTPCSADSDSKMPPKTIIVGAGISGLAAAAHLENNVLGDYIILEATDKIGGRIKTISQQQDGINFTLEIGAGWIHGTENNPIYDLAKENDLLELNDWTNKEKIRRFSEAKREFRLGDSTVILNNTWMPVYGIYRAAIDKAESFFEEGLPNGFSQNASLESFAISKFYETFNETSFGRHWMRQRSVMENLLLFETWLSGCHSMDEVSLKYFGSFKTIKGDDVPLPKGYETVIDAIKQDIPDHKIKFNHVVEKIEHSTNESMVKVTCKNGAMFEADHVIVTSSLGFLKSNAAAMFDPPLPDDKMAAIRKLGFGTADRIYMEFENLDFITNKDVGMIFFVRKPDELTDSATWENKIFICYVTDVPKANVLTCWLTGKQAEEMEQRSQQEVGTRMRELLQNFLGTNVSEPLKVIRSRWSSEEFIKGSYTFIKVGSSVDDIKTLAEPIFYYHENNTKPIVLFAGEATHEEYHSTTHGAYLSGIREADNIINSYAKRSNINKTIIIVMLVFVVLLIILIAVGICLVNRKSEARYALAPH